MKKPGEDKPPKAKTPGIALEENKKRLRRLEIQKDILKKIMDPLTEQIQEDYVKEAALRSERENKC
ncbi:MAG: hypothetical protein ACOYN5_12680 [Bacteroidales bacterium]